MSAVVGVVAEGVTDEQILAAYPDLEDEDVHEALRYAAEAHRSQLRHALSKP